MSFRWRFVGAISAVNVLTLAVAFVTVGQLVGASQQRQFDDALRREAREEAAEIALAGGRRLRITPRLGPSPDDIGPLTKYAVLYDHDDAVLDATSSWDQIPAAAELAPTTFGDLDIDGVHLRGMVLEIPDHPGVRLLLAAPRTDLDTDARILNRVMALVFGLATLMTILLTSGVVRQLTHVHARIAQVARRVFAADLSARVGEVRGDPEIVQLASDVDAMIERIEVLLRNQSEFIAHAAHELRSPLTSLYGELSHAIRRSRDPEQYREAIDAALDATRRLMALADDLLALARVGRTPDPGDASVNLVEVCHEALALVAAEAKARDVDIEPRIAAALEVRGNFMDLVRLIRNLLDNAIGHAPPHTRVELELELDQRRSSAIVRVRDHGPGIGPDDAERIFQPFYRGGRERAEQRPGSGLGLAIAREIAQQHRGELELATDQQPGACFVARLPLDPGSR
ncbi:MAG TPA: HAMP domain-containing sensor histidine kinase [Enhygromyxa sp.]|nr:HAMP domain-containing sensor histidine kinase [Enhygromyxa sp.]